MEKYEIVVIVDATTPPDQKDTIVKETTDAINKCEGKVINSQVWLDKHKLSFRMGRCTEGTFYLINFEILRSAMAKLQQLIKLNERIVRSLIIRID